MDLSLTASQTLIRDSARSFVERHAPRAELVKQAKAGQSWNSGWFAHFKEAGWIGALVPEDLGGMDLDPLSAALILEELGRGAVSSPLIASSVVSACLLRGSAPSKPRDDALKSIADGSAIIVPALRKPETSWNGIAATCTPLSGSGSLSLSGAKVFVPFADAATHFLVSVSTPGDASAAFAIVPAKGKGISVHQLSGWIEASHEVHFENIPIAASDIVRAAGGTYDDALAGARVAIAAYQVGGMAEMLDMSIHHSNTREQFGTPVGRFQRVQDHIIRLLNACDSARWSTYEAAWALEANRNGVARSYLAGSMASDSYIEAANAAHEVHAAIGSDPMYGLTLYTRISRSMYDMLGNPAWQRRQMAEAMHWQD
jgi:alkylation response protein AidB-like acyl-CoA dehydrogenase